MAKVRSSLLAVVFGIGMIVFGSLCVFLLATWPKAPNGRPADGARGEAKPKFFISGEDEGRWRPYRDPRAANSEPEELSAEQQRKIAELQKIGYLSGNVSAGGENGLTVHDADRAYAGLNFYTTGSGPDAVLMDMDGTELHHWHCEFDALVSHFPENDLDSESLSRPDEDREFLRRAVLFPNGDMLAIFEGSALFKVDKDSNILWALPNRAHHDLSVQPDGSIYVLTRTATLDPKIDTKEPVLKDYVVHLTSNGEKLEEYSLWDAVANSAHSMLLLYAPPSGDLFHTNTLEILDGSHENLSPFFRKGNILVSLLELSAIAVLDPGTGKIVWSMNGMWREQHQPTFLENGDMLIFDNLGGSGNVDARPRNSRVIEFNPMTQEIVWSYGGSAEAPLFSRTCGSNQRLPNGNTLITESDNGRAFEVTPDKEIVWEFVNPARAGAKKNLIASIFELVRYEPDYATFLSSTEK